MLHVNTNLASGASVARLTMRPCSSSTATAPGSASGPARTAAASCAAFQGVTGSGKDSRLAK